jgi:hypothetical protein
MLSWISNPTAFLQSLLICLGAFVFGLFVRHRETPHLGITALSILAFGMTATGLWLWIAGHAPPHVDPDQEVYEIIGSILLSIPGFIIACITCGMALATARRVGHSRWFVALLIASVLPLLATLVIWQSTFQVICPQCPWPSVVVGALPLTFAVAPIGPVALVVYGLYGLYGQITPRRRPTSKAV